MNANPFDWTAGIDLKLVRPGVFVNYWIGKGFLLRVNRHGGRESRVGEREGLEECTVSRAGGTGREGGTGGRIPLL